MSSPKTKIKIQETCSELLHQAGFLAKVEAVASGDFTILKIEVEFKRPLKETVSFVGALGYLLRLILLQNGEEPKILIDINGYRKKRQAEVVQLVGEKIASMNNDEHSIALPPMNAYDRRLVHQAVGENASFVSESFGMGRQRRVIIKKREELG